MTVRFVDRVARAGRVVPLVAALTLFAVAASAQEQGICDGSQRMAQILTGKYGELPRHQGADLVMWANAATGTWSLVRMHTPQRWCIIAAGGQYREPRSMGEAS